MKKIILFLLTPFFFFSCESFLDTENLTRKDTGNYPANPNDMNEMLTGVYRAARTAALDEAGPNLFCEYMADDRFSGGGPDDNSIKSMEQFESTNPNFCEQAWGLPYQTIFRANTLIEVIDNIAWEDESERNHILGQTYFLRAISYYSLATVFGTAPLITSTAPVNIPRDNADVIFAQIAQDLKTAIELLPGTPRGDRGRATKWASQALMARAFLFYTGYYNKASLPLTDGGEVTKANVSAYLNDCITNSGHDLVGDFRNLWPYSNDYTKADGYKYSQDNDLSWVKEDGNNVENMFSWLSFAGASWDNDVYQSNRLPLYLSIREQPEAGIFPFGKGWGWGTVNTRLWESWSADDLRRKGSIIDVNDTNEMPSYQWGADNQQDETGYWAKKYITVNVNDAAVGYVNYAYRVYGSVVSTDYMINNTQDFYVIRFADVLLMAAEINEDAAPLNKVRARAGLADVSYTAENLRSERRHELAFEGLRYYDLMRWGTLAAAVNTKNGVSIKNANVDATKNIGDLTTRIQQTGGFMPIPQSQIDLSAGVLVQTPGW